VGRYLHKLHVRNLISQCTFYYKSELRLGHFNTQNLLHQTSLTRSLGTCQLILISPTGILNIGWIPTHCKSAENTSKNSHPQYLTLSVQSNSRSLSGYLFNITFLAWLHLHAWTQACNLSGFANTEQRLFWVAHLDVFSHVVECIFLLRQDNVICQALLDLWQHSGNPCTIYVLLMVPLDTLTITYSRTSDVLPLSNVYKNWITQF
jgi:hypothetical protein